MLLNDGVALWSRCLLTKNSKVFESTPRGALNDPCNIKRRILLDLISILVISAAICLQKPSRDSLLSEFSLIMVVNGLKMLSLFLLSIWLHLVFNRLYIARGVLQLVLLKMPRRVFSTVKGMRQGIAADFLSRQPLKLASDAVKSEVRKRKNLRVYLFPSPR